MAQRISEKTIQEIAERISILDVVSPYVQLKQAGNNHKGLCPFHPDKNPSFVVNPERKTFHCFGCGVGGDIFGFFMKFHNVPFLEALRELGRQAGVRIEQQSSERDLQREESQRQALAANQLACRFYHDHLAEKTRGEIARRYLQQRGVQAESIAGFLLGYAPDSWDGLAQFLVRKGESPAMALSLGLILPRKSGTGFYDRFRNRLMFPILGTTGQVLGFGARALDDQGPKYLNSPESPLYHKGSNLYGLHLAQKSIRERDLVIVVEGYLDLIALHEFGFSHSVAVLGTALTAEQIQILQRYTRNFLLLFDGDDAGRKASFRNLPSFLERGISGRVVYLPEQEDPDSCLRKWGREPFQKRIDGALPLLDVFLDQQLGDTGKSLTVERKASALREVLPLINRIPDRLEQNLHIKALAERVGIEELFLREELADLTKRTKAGTALPKRIPTEETREPPEERMLCQILIQYPVLIPRFVESNVLESFSSHTVRVALAAILDVYREEDAVNLSRVLSLQTDPKIIRLLTSLSCREEFTREEATVALEDSIRRILRKGFQSRMILLNRRIAEAERNQQGDLQNRLFQEKQSLLEQEKTLLR